MSNNRKITILYGSQTGTAQDLAEQIYRESKLYHFNGPVQSMDCYDVTNLINEVFVIFVCSTTGQGDEPDNMKSFWRFLLRRNLPSDSLSNLRYGVLGLGDSSYSKFNFVAKRLGKRLSQLGGREISPIGLCDDQHDLGAGGVYFPWIADFWKRLLDICPLPAGLNVLTCIPQQYKWNVSIADDNKENNGEVKPDNADIYDGCTDAVFDKPFTTKVLSNVRTTSSDHFQDVRVISFNSKNVQWYPGDVLVVRPINSQEKVQDLFNLFSEHNLQLFPETLIQCHQIDADEPKALYLAFSLHRNTRDLLKIEPRTSKSIECFYGLRALAAFWVIAGHRIFKEKIMLTEPLTFTSPFSAFIIRVLWNNSYPVDTFFLMAGVLITQSMLRSLDEKKVNLFKIYVGRYGRYMPTLAVLLLFFTSSFPSLLVDGPLVHYLHSKIEPCRQYWWSSMLLIQTYVNPNSLCMKPTWFLSADFHLFLLSPLIIFLVWRFRYKAFWLLAAIILSTHLGIFFARYYDTVSDAIIYYQTHFRLAQFLVGIALGYIMYERKGKTHMKKKIMFIGWAAAILPFIIIETNREMYKNQRFVEAFYASVRRLAWAALTSWTIFVCHHLKSGGIVNWFLSHPLWQPVAKISMSIFLIHDIYIVMSIANMAAPLVLNSAWLIHIIGGDIIVSILLGVVLYLVIEAPSNLILKCILR